MKDELRAITKNQRSFDSAVIRSSLMPSEKYSCSGSSLMLVKGSTAITGLSGTMAARRGAVRASTATVRSGILISSAGMSSEPTKRSPLREMVRISFWSRPVSPTALRAA